MHARSKIIEAVKDRINSSFSLENETGFPADVKDTPEVRILFGLETTSESLKDVGQGTAVWQRTAALHIQIRVNLLDQADEYYLDTLAEQMERLLAQDLTLGGMTPELMEYSSTEVNYSTDEKEASDITLTYLVPFKTNATEPETPI